MRIETFERDANRAVEHHECAVSVIAFADDEVAAVEMDDPCVVSEDSAQRQRWREYGRISLPEWFESLNRDFRYQLTVLGQFAQAIVSGKVSNHQFTIKTDKPNVEVSWQVTGVRQDVWANAHRIPVEVQKAEKDRGMYLHPELFGQSMDKSIALAHHPSMRMALKHKSGVTEKH